jgi:hypothetical protein
VFLVKKGAAPINVSNDFNFIHTGELRPTSYKNVMSFLTEDWIGTESSSQAADLYYYFSNDGDNLSIYLETILLQTITSNDTTNTSVLDVMEFNDGIGEFYDYGDESAGIVRGSFKFEKGVPSEVFWILFSKAIAQIF